MKKLLLILLIIGVAGCEPPHKKDTHPQNLPIENILKNGTGELVIIDSCEYYKLQFHGAGYMPHYNLIHKGNCKNCRKFYRELFNKTEKQQ